MSSRRDRSIARAAVPGAAAARLHGVARGVGGLVALPAVLLALAMAGAGARAAPPAASTPAAAPSTAAAPARPAATALRTARAQGAPTPPPAGAASGGTNGAPPGPAPVPAPVTGAGAANGAGATNHELLRPFKAEFTLEWKGMNAASASLELTRQSASQYTYVSRNTARGMFRAVFPDELTQVSRLQLDGGQVRPLSYRGDDGAPDAKRDVSLDFDWVRRRVTGTAETRAVDLELRPGMQDIMSVQIALMVDLQQGRRPTGYVLVDKDQVKDYVYVGEGAASIATPLGQLETVVWSSHRPNSNRVTRVWYAPSLGYAPVRAERRRGDKLEWSMRLVALAR